MKTFLIGLGLSRHEARALLTSYGSRSLDLMKSPKGRKELASVIEESSIKAAHMQYCRIWLAKSFFSLLEGAGISSETAYRLYLSCGEDEEAANAALAENPYRLVFEEEGPFSAAESAAELASEVFGYETDMDVRMEAALYSALCLAEKGLDEPGEDKLSKYISEYAGSTCLPVGKLLELAQILLNEASEDELLEAAMRLHRRKVLVLTRKTVHGETSLYAARQHSALTEIEAAAIIRHMLESGVPEHGRNIFEIIDRSQASLGLLLSYEQVNAVKMALTSRISVITGGPGTGKTATQKILLESYRRLSGGKSVSLMAPTGQAAKRMTAATGYPAATIHSALGIVPGEFDAKKARKITSGLVIVDETSMLDASLLCILLKSLSDETRLVIVGDPDQLPSIGAGNVLSELLNCVPVSRLTKVFRQGDDSDVAFNAARIKVGSTQMIKSERFTFVEAEGSDNIQKAVCETYKTESEQAGAENVIVLTPLRRSTSTGVNKLNVALRKTLSDEKRYLESNGIRLYNHDKVVFLRNRYGLVNGEIGKITDIKGDTAECQFGDTAIKLSGTQLSWIDPAYAQTIHKSQGDEYKTVILVADKAHRMTKKMAYTAVTRAREKLIVVGNEEAFKNAILSEGEKRFSLLSALVEEA